MNHCPRLIEVALPIREISAESVRDKYIPSLHPKHIHMWWARRPLAAARAVVFASLVPDPDHEECPEGFRHAVKRLLKDQVPQGLRGYLRRREYVADPDPYKPYDGVNDTLRNRLLTFIAKWSPEELLFEQGKIAERPSPNSLLDDRSLVKWETSDPSSEQGRLVLSLAHQLIEAASGHPQRAADPFAGGGTIPLELARLGVESIANDYNPVAHLILRATCEYPHRFGVTGHRTRSGDTSGDMLGAEIGVSNVLTHDLRVYAEKVLTSVRAHYAIYYPPGEDGRSVAGYIWTRTIPCPNPTCRGPIPLFRSLLLGSAEHNKVAITIDADPRTKSLSFGIVKGSRAGSGQGTKKQRGPATCPFCNQPASENDIRLAAVTGCMKSVLVAAVTEIAGTKDYRAIEESDLNAWAAVEALHPESPPEYIVPEINGPNASPKAGSHRSISLELYGMKQWGQIFNTRQLSVLTAFCNCIRDLQPELEQRTENPEYAKAILTLLGLWVSRIAMFSNTLCRWESGLQRPKTPFGGQSIPMMWDFPEINPFGSLAGTAETQLDYMIRAIDRQSGKAGVLASRVLYGSATALPLPPESVDLVITDPPYGNSIAYADLADFFYVWLKRCLDQVWPELFATPQTPKALEATSHKHRHEGSQSRADRHYYEILRSSFVEMRRICRNPKLISVMFAHQTTEAWTALLTALFDAGLAPNATWPIATEMPTTAFAMGTASLETSVTVVCRPREVGTATTLKQVRNKIEHVVRDAVHRFWGYGFRGADLIVACYGPAVGVFGQYERVERADGSPVDIPTLLELARELALKAIAGEFEGDPLSRLYFVWANQYGISPQAYDDLVKVAQMGTDTENAADLAHQRGLFVADGPTCRLALLRDRIEKKRFGEEPDAPLIDKLHHALHLWKAEQRPELVRYLKQQDLLDDTAYWKLAQALFEVLPRGEEDWKLVSALLSERETLQSEAKRVSAGTEEEGRLL